VKKLKYASPKAELLMFVPDHALAASNDNSAWWSFWTWGKQVPNSYSAAGTVEVWDDTNAPGWVYKGQDEKKPY